MEYDSDNGEPPQCAQCNQSVSSQDSSHVEIADKTASMSNAKKNLSKREVWTRRWDRPFYWTDTVTGLEFVLAAAVDKKEGEASSSFWSENGKVNLFHPPMPISGQCCAKWTVSWIVWILRWMNWLALEWKCVHEKRGRWRKLKEVQYQAALADQRSDAVEQYTRLTNLRFFNIEETEKWETAETSEDKVLAIIRDKLELRHVKSEDTEIAHRVGKRNRSASHYCSVRVAKSKNEWGSETAKNS